MTNLQTMGVKARNRNLNKRDLIYEYSRNYFINRKHSSLRLGSSTDSSRSSMRLSCEH